MKIFKSSSSLIVRNIFWVILIVVRKMQWGGRCTTAVLVKLRPFSMEMESHFLSRILPCQHNWGLFYCQFFLLFFLHNSWIFGKVLKGEMWYIWFGLSFPLLFFPRYDSCLEWDMCPWHGSSELCKWLRSSLLERRFHVTLIRAQMSVTVSWEG